MRLTLFMNEDTINKGLGITFVDLDETLFNTFAKIKVMKDGKEIALLSNAEYNAYTLKDGESFDYSEFRSASLFYHTSKPIEKMMMRISKIVKRVAIKGSKVVILTARSDFDNKSLFLHTFRKYGFPIDQTHVIRAGNIQGIQGVSETKQKIVIDFLRSGIYRRARIFDDFLKTCQDFLNIKDNIPQDILDKIREINNVPPSITDEHLVHFEAYHVDEEGTVRKL